MLRKNQRDQHENITLSLFGPDYSASACWGVQLAHMPQIQEGQTIAVKVDPKAPEMVFPATDWAMTPLIRKKKCKPKSEEDGNCIAVALSTSTKSITQRRKIKILGGKMNRKLFGAMLAIMALSLALMACSIMSMIPGMPNLGNGQQTIWSDVPPFEGATQDPSEALGTSMFNQAQADQKSKMETMIFHTTKQPPEVAAFYTADRMKQFDWNSSGLGGKTGCTQDKYEGQPRTICEFAKKNEEGREIELSIDARPDPKGNAIRLIFVRTTGSLITK